MPEPPAPLFRTIYSGGVRAQFAEWVRQARVAGLTSSLQEALRFIDRQLATDPLNWGEARNRLRRANLVVCSGFHARILVRYGVDEPRRLVYVNECRLLPGHPLYPGS
jgi:hypothetical protein